MMLKNAASLKATARCGRGRALAVKVQASAPKTALITGGNTGIGYETALVLTKKGYEVILACKDSTRAANAQKKLREAVPGCTVSTVPLDLADLASVRDCAKRVLDNGKPLDVLLNNAGVMACPKMSTKDGFEFQLGVNHLGHFLLTQQLLPSLIEANKPVRIINVASAAHQFGQVDFNDLMRDKDYQPWEAYGQSKLANIMYTYELARRLPPGSPITVNCLHPGVVRTELGRYMLQDAWYMPALIAVAQLFFKSPEQGAETSIHLASAPGLENISSKYFIDCKPAQSSAASYDSKVGRQLFDVSAELTRADVPSTLLVGSRA